MTERTSSPHSLPPPVEGVPEVWRHTLRGDEAPDSTCKAQLSVVPTPVSPHSLPPPVPATSSTPPPAASVLYADTLDLDEPDGDVDEVAPGDEGFALGVTVAVASNPGAVSTPSRRKGLAPQAPVPLGSTPDFEVLRVLGRGGMSVVYGARQSSLARDVALKMAVLPGGPGQLEAAERFIAEAHVTGELEHPNIVPVYDLRTDPRGNLFIAMKLVRGRSWRELLHPPAGAPEPKTLREHVEILLRVCDAVAFAHSHGVVHRDLKPENVMVGDFGEVLVMDWGIAVDVTEVPKETRKAVHRSAVSGPAGTPSYMAPELASADPSAIGPRTDVYLLGATLYEVLTRTAPHRGDSVWLVLAAAALGELQTPEQRAPEREIPRELSRIVQKAMAARPEERFGSVAELQLALRAFLAHEESLRLTEDSFRLLERLEARAKVRAEERYAQYTEVLAGFAQALRLWAENEQAARGQAEAAAAYAEEALDRGDTGLAAAQLPVLEGNAHADKSHLAALRAAVGKASTSRLRSFVGVALLALLGLLGVRWLSGWRSAQHARAETASAMRAEERKHSAAWEAVRRGDLAGVNRAVARDPDWEEMSWARSVLLWSRGAWGELFASLRVLEPGASSPALGGRILRRPEVQGSRLAAALQARGVHALPSARERTLEDGELWGILGDTARAGVPLPALTAATEELEREERERWERTHRRPARAEARRVLRRGALYGLARDSATLRGDMATAFASERLLVPYSLSEASFGPEARGGIVPLVQRSGEGAWQAFDPVRGTALWQTDAVRSTAGADTTLPVADGSVVLLGGGVLARVAARDGAPLARAYTDGETLLAWPDPADRAQLVLAVSTDRQRGYVHEVRLREGRTSSPLFQNDDVGAMVSPLARPQGWIDRLERDARAALDPGLSLEAAERALRARTLEGLRALATRSPEDPAVWLALLEASAEGGADAAERARWARSARDHAEELLPTTRVALGLRLDEAGFEGDADALFDSAARDFLARGGNADLAAAHGAAPVSLLRARGGALFRAGNTARALALVEVGRRFSTFREGDHEFYLQYSAWLRSQGRDVRPLQQRVREARLAGGVGAQTPLALVGLDLLSTVLLATPLLLWLLVLRLWLRSRPTRLRDQYARGMRTWTQRVSTFLTHPVERVSLIFLSYASHGERATVVLLAALLLFGGSLAAAQVRTVGRVEALPEGIANGYAGSDSMHRFLQERAQTEGASASLLRLRAEGESARNELSAAAATLAQAQALDPTDALAANNLAALQEARGELPAARAGYTRARGLRGDGAAVASWNLARLGGDAAARQRAFASLAHRDRLAAEANGGRGPLWARCGYADLHEELASTRALLHDAAMTFTNLATGEMDALASLSRGDSPLARAAGARGFQQLTGYGALLVGVLALLWLPLPVRPLARGAGEPASRAERSSRNSQLTPFRRLGRRVGLALSALLGVFVPGGWELLRGNMVLGVVAALLTTGAAGVRTIGEGHGLYSASATPSQGPGWFEGVTVHTAHPLLAFGGSVGLVLLMVLYGVFVPLTLLRAVRAWRERGLT